MFDIIPGLQSTASALNAERIRSDAISENIANALSTRRADGGIYQRQKVVFESVLQQQTGQNGMPGAVAHNEVNVHLEKDDKPPRLVADPNNPGAMIEVPDINIHQEMIDLIISQRVYEANLAVAKSARSMAVQTLSIGRRS